MRALVGPIRWPSLARVSGAPTVCAADPATLLRPSTIRALDPLSSLRPLAIGATDPASLITSLSLVQALPALLIDLTDPLARSVGLAHLLELNMSFPSGRPRLVSELGDLLSSLLDGLWVVAI